MILVFITGNLVFHLAKSEEIQGSSTTEVEAKAESKEITPEEELSPFRWTETLRLRDIYFSGLLVELKERIKTYSETVAKEYEKHPSVFSVAIDHGLMLIDLRELDKARVVWGRAVKDFIGNDTPKVYKAWIDAYNGNYEAAKDVWFPIARQKAENVGLWLPYHIDSFVGLYFIREYLSEADKKEIEDLVLTFSNRFANHPKFGAIAVTEMLREGKLKAAANRIARIMIKNPDDPLCVTLLGVAELISHNHEQALKLFNESDKVNPNSPTNHLMKARALHALKQKKEAQSEINKVIALDPTLKTKKWDKSKVLSSKSYVKIKEVASKDIKNKKDKAKEELKESKVDRVPENPDL